MYGPYHKDHYDVFNLEDKEYLCRSRKDAEIVAKFWKNHGAYTFIRSSFITTEEYLEHGEQDLKDKLLYHLDYFANN
jgi:hypothetical protein